MLHDLQREFAGVALTNDTSALVPQVLASSGTCERRLRVYRTNTVNSLTDVLKSAFPVTERIVGERFFQAAALAFLERHPPRRPTLYRYGETLPGFLETFEPAQSLVYLPDVARLEWARIESYFAADQDALDPNALADVVPERVESVVLTFHPSVRLIESAFPILKIWTVNQPDYSAVPEIDFDVAEQGLVQRRGQLVVQHPVSRGAFEWLRLIGASTPLGEATSAALAKDSTFDLQDTLRVLLADGSLTGLNSQT